MTATRSGSAAEIASAAARSAWPQPAATRASPSGSGWFRRVAAYQWAGQAVVALEGLERKPLLVGEPAPVDGIGVDAQEPQHLIARRLHGDAVTRRVGVGALDLLEVPGPGLEPVRLGGQRAHRADLHGVAAEVARERFVGERVDLGLIAAVDEMDQRVAGDLFREPGAAVAQDAALAVEEDVVVDRDGLFEVALLFDEAGLAGPIGHRLILERALAALVADRAIEGMVDEQELEDAVLGLLGDVGLGVDHHVVADGQHATGLQRRTATGVDLDDAHPAHTDRLHPRVVAESGDVDPGVLACVDQQRTRLGGDGLAVDRHGDGLGRPLDSGHAAPRSTSVVSDSPMATATGIRAGRVM